MHRYLLVLAILLAAIVTHLQIEAPISLGRQWVLVLGAELGGFGDFQFYYSSLPRVVLALIVGGVMGLTGSILQQLLQNSLVSPMTLGAASGAWLGVLLFTMLAPSLVAAYGPWAAVTGAMVSVGLVVIIAGRHGLDGLPVILAGMAVNLLLGAIASAAILINDQYAKDLFIWGAGDLAQTDWQWVEWLLPRLWLLPLLLVFGARPLTLLRMGQGAAQGRGLSLWPLMLVLLVASLWLNSVVITAVGLIGFVGLLTPNMARMMGSRTPRDELFFSLLLGALLLVVTDMVALQFSQWSKDMVPTGAATALIGAPALIWLARNRLKGFSNESRQFIATRLRIQPVAVVLLVAAIPLLGFLALFVSPAATGGWQFGWTNDLIFSLRWPRVLAAISAGTCLAVAGVVMQRLIRNPLASPDILGLSAGATMALVLTVMLFGGSIREAGPVVAFAGALAVLLLLMVLGKRHSYAPGILALTGISLGALMDAVVQFSLARGGQDTTAVIGWLAGSTYSLTYSQSLLITGCAVVGIALALASHRVLTLVSIGDGFAAGRGLHLTKARMGLLFLVAVLCAVTTSVIGPIAFVGLMAPHMATLVGARSTQSQLVVAAVFGALLMLVADWFGRVIIYPWQLPAGLLASLLGGFYFIALLLRRRLS